MERDRQTERKKKAQNQFCHMAKYQIEWHKLVKIIDSLSRETKKRQQWYQEVLRQIKFVLVGGEKSH